VDLVGDKGCHRCRDSIKASDRFIFLLSKHSLDEGSFTLTELRFAREKWPAAKRAVLPVIIDKDLDLHDVPVYLTSVHVFQPEGNVPAEVASEIEKTASPETSLGWLSGVLPGR